MQSSLLSREDSLLLVIDVQEKLMPVIRDNDQIVENVVKLVKFAGIIDLPVLVTEQQKLGSTLPQVASELDRNSPVGKISFDCFGCSEFRDKLDGLGKKNLILAGVESHICVAQTALTAVNNYRVQVVSDAVGSRSSHNWLIALERLRTAGVEITTTEMVIYELLGRAGTDEFKATLPLVK